jgi:zinc-binding alcohol dehydrogenase/oxidoreductase
VYAVRVHEGGRLVYEEVADPTPEPDEVLVELRAAGVNRRDMLVSSGVYPFSLPLVPGSDGAGIRRDTGEEVVLLPAVGWGDREDAPGDDFEFFGGPRDGTYAELVAAPADALFPKPAGFSWEEAAAFPLAALTAYRALFVRGDMQAGETVLVLGAGSGVSTFALLLAQQGGGRVLVTSSSDAKIARKGGRVVVFGGTGGTEVTLQVRPFYFAQQSLHGTQLGSPLDFTNLLRALEVARWKPVIDSVYRLSEAADAHARMAKGEHFGKLVLTID